MGSERTILVAGATGQQGGAVARHLLDAGLQVRGLTRDPDGEKARALRATGLELVRGDMVRPESLREALGGVTGVFAMATPFEGGPEVEVAQGTGLGDAAAEAGVSHYVYSSVGGADRATAIPHFDSKWRIEEHLRGLGLPLTVIQPVWFFDDLAGPAMQPAGDGFEIPMPIATDRPLQGVAVDDIAVFATKAFSDPDEWIGREFELGDERTIPQYAAAVSRALGVHVEHRQVPWDALRERDEDSSRMYEWFQRSGYDADITRLREQHPGLRSFEQWLDEGRLSTLREAA